MRKNVATLLITLFALFAVASFVLLGGIVRQWQALGMTVEIVRATTVDDDRMPVVLARIDDFDRYQKISNQIITGRSDTLKGIADLSDMLHTNIRHFSLGLLFSLSGLIVTGIAIYLRLRSCMQQLARTDGRTAI